MKIASVAAAFLILTLLTGCGGGDDGKADEPVPSVSAAPTTPTSSAPPAYVENETCRTGMAPLVEIMLANGEGGLEFNVFDNRLTQLQNQIDAAVAPCTSAVNNPAREVMYQFAAADARWRTCAKGPCVDQVTQFVTEGWRKAHRVQEALEATT